eukprot:30821-Pelagococcus_subviridis.AAC.8
MAPENPEATDFPDEDDDDDRRRDAASTPRRRARGPRDGRARRRRSARASREGARLATSRPSSPRARDLASRRIRVRGAREVDLLEELPLVKLEFPHVRSRDGRVVAPSADRLLGSRCSRLKPSADAGPARTTCSKTS